jgi:hypothetical protein
MADRPTAQGLVAQLAEVLGRLNEYIAEAAERAAEPRIAAAEKAARLRVTAAGRAASVQRERDEGVIAELRRQVDARDRSLAVALRERDAARTQAADSGGMGSTSPVARLERIAGAHVKDVDAHGGTWGDCRECGRSWPCPTYAWATDPNRSALSCWDPSDDTEASR